ncbi:TatD family hydrolase [Niallia nealsonii]|uniref:TatD family deoxyribonuclease n=1 Tax=Niallia nealsonii TaxID=115979 RepID=A0A2N0Z142_9BACI|nr:TatD family hydrolase [Niallia nealsonii]PKG23225.1 TatD family deoxyribonuclease [Niallia nealsonii]
MKKIIDAHIHLNQYKESTIKKIQDEKSIEGVISVSMDQPSCIRNFQLANCYSFVHAAFGFHPEQPLPKEKELADLIIWIKKHQQHMTAIGEVGLPHYVRKKDPTAFPLEPYIEVLEQFILLAKEFSKPICLHSIYEEAPIVLGLLEKHNYMHAHFHWFKGDEQTIDHLIVNGCFVSITPDLLYEKEIQKLAAKFPLEQLMVETDGPWPFEGPFSQKKTVPYMMHDTVHQIANIKKIQVETVYDCLLSNTKKFFSIL